MIYTTFCNIYDSTLHLFFTCHNQDLSKYANSKMKLSVFVETRLDASELYLDCQGKLCIMDKSRAYPYIVSTPRKQHQSGFTRIIDTITGSDMSSSIKFLYM